MSDPILEVHDLKVVFRTREGKNAHANDGVNVTVSQGEVVALVGESGLR